MNSIHNECTSWWGLEGEHQVDTFCSIKTIDPDVSDEIVQSFEDAAWQKPTRALKNTKLKIRNAAVSLAGVNKFPHLNDDGGDRTEDHRRHRTEL